MARQDGLDLLDQAGSATKLREAYLGIQDNYQKLSNVAKVKARTIGAVNAGSFVFPRFKNATVNTYGTARTAGAGVAGVKEEVTVNLSVHKEIVEEFEKFDLETVGFDVIAQRIFNHPQRMMANNDRAFWSAIKTTVAAYDTANSATHSANITWPKATTPDYLDLIEQLIVKVETTSSNYIDGVTRDLIFVAVRPAIYSKIQQKLDTIYAYNGNSELVEVPAYHGVMVFSELFLPSGTDFIAGIIGGAAMPVRSDGYTQPEKIGLSNAYAVSLFWDYGIAALAPEAFYEGEFAEAAV
jgi:hypothetical protein